MNVEHKENILTAEDYLAFIDKMGGEDETSKEQAERAIANQLYSVTAVLDGEHIGMARLIGDTAIFFYINDVWVLPEYQGRGIGSHMTKMLIQYVKETAIKGTSVSLCLMCAKGKEGFYEKLGFAQRPHEWEGASMEMELDI